MGHLPYLVHVTEINNYATVSEQKNIIVNVTHNQHKLKVSEIYSSASENELSSTDEDSEKHE